MLELGFLDERERALVADALARLPPAAADAARADLTRLAALADAVRGAPPIALASDGATALLGCSGDEVELLVPDKAVIGGAYLVLKIGLFRRLATALAPDAPALAARAAAEAAQSIHSKLLEELLVGVVTDRSGPLAPRRRALALLGRLWDDRLATEIDDLAPLLEGAWRARAALRPVYGTLLGASEIAQLVAGAGESWFVDHLLEELDDAARQAFEEFLFDLSTEELARLRAEMRAEGLTALGPAELARRLGRPAPPPVAPAAPADGCRELDRSQALYASYRARAARARARRLLGVPGPTTTAEELVIRRALLACDD
jgi:hypothetical protein